jgi:hypothetical protein
MRCRLPFVECLPALLLTIVMTGALAYVRFAPIPGEAVAAVYRPGASLSRAIGLLAGDWRVLGIAAVRPFPVLLLRAAPGAAALPGSPPGAWLLLRATGAVPCGQSLTATDLASWT